ncbi:MAG: WG repeat-containing protein, partial [Cytophagaceae bacterium]
MKKSLFIFILIFCSALSFSQSLHGILLPIQEDGKWGLIDTSGKIVLKPQYDHIGLFGRYGFAISRKANKFGFISLHDRISEPVYDQVRVINENYVLLQEQQDWKIMKVSSGKLFFNLHQGNLLSEFQRGYFLWKQGEKLGVFDTAGQIVLPCEYDSIALMRYMKEVLIVKKNNLYGFNRLRDGRQLLAPLLKTYQRYGYHLVYKDEHGNTGLITGKGTVVSARWDEVSPMNDRMVQVRKGNKWGLVHSDNDSLIVKPAYDYFWYYHHSLVIGVKGGKWELINDQGKTIIPGKYEHIYKISEELAAVQQGKLWGLVREKNGEVVISPRYEYIGYDFNRFFLLSTYHGKKGMISLQGKVIHEPVFDDIDYFNESVKCYLGSRAILYKFNTKGEITAKFTPAEFCSLHMPYHVRVKHPGSRGGGCGGNYSNRIEYWYFDPRVKKWGFKYPRHTYHEDKAYYNYKDEIIVEPRFNEVDFYKDFVKVMQYSKIAGSNDSAMTYGIYERYAPQMVAPVRFSDINMKNLEIARVTGAKELNGSWVMISTEKEYPETIIPIISDHNNKYTLKGFGNFDRMTGLAPIKLKRENTDEPGRWGFSDVAGTVFIPPLYEDATDFRTFEIKSGHWTLIYVSDPSDTANILLSKEKWIRE